MRTLRHTVTLATVLAVLAVAAAATALRAQYAGGPAAAGRSRGHDVVWLGHAWVDGRRTAAGLALPRSRVRARHRRRRAVRPHWPAGAGRHARRPCVRRDRHRRTFGLSLHVDFGGTPRAGEAEGATSADWAAYRSGWGTGGGTP